MFLLSTTIALNREKCFAHTTREKEMLLIVCTKRGSEERENQRESERIRREKYFDIEKIASVI